MLSLLLYWALTFIFRWQRYIRKHPSRRRRIHFVKSTVSLSRIWPNWFTAEQWAWSIWPIWRRICLWNNYDGPFKWWGKQRRKIIMAWSNKVRILCIKRNKIWWNWWLGVAIFTLFIINTLSFQFFFSKISWILETNNTLPLRSLPPSGYQILEV